MRSWILRTCLLLCFCQGTVQLFSESAHCEDLNIQYASSDDYEALSDAYASRGENYLILGHDQTALEDFTISYKYALDSEDPDNHLAFRALFGAFLAYVRLENLDAAQELFVYLDEMLKNACSGCTEASCYLGSDRFNPVSIQLCNSDYPIFGPDEIPVRDCMERVETTVRAISILIAAVKKSEIRVLAVTLINQLADSAYHCCKAGGLWKACLQKLVNKLHYWKVLGIPADPAWD